MLTIDTFREQVEQVKRELERLRAERAEVATTRAEIAELRADVIRRSPQLHEDRAVGRLRHPAFTAVPRIP